MKKKSILFLFVLPLAYLAITSYSSNSVSGTGNRTGSDGSTPSCGNCHGSVSSKTTANITLKSGTTTVTSYIPGYVYDVYIGGSNTSSMTLFGFQFSSILSSKAQAGVLTTATAAQSIGTNGGLSILQHNGTNSGLTTAGTKVGTWKAPTKGSGAVSFYLILNVVNGDNNATSSDNYNYTNITLNENTTGVNSINDNSGIKVFPIPAEDELNISIEHPENDNYKVTIVDITGKVFHSENILSNGNTILNKINISAFPKGVFYAYVSNGISKKMIPFVKQ